MLYFTIYLLLHFAIYAVVLRRRPLFHRELPIFLYHVLPASLAAIGAVGSIIAEPSVDLLLQAVWIVAIQGMYSLSFLELWALSQGGYSIHILSRHESSYRNGTLAEPTGLDQFGAAKKGDRLRGLRHLRLIRAVPGGYGLSTAGRVVAGFLNVVRWVANVRESGKT